MTLDEIAAIEREYLTAKEVASVLGCNSYAITVQVREDKQNGVNSFPFPTAMIGKRVKVMKKPFLAAMGYKEDEQDAV